MSYSKSNQQALENHSLDTESIERTLRNLTPFSEISPENMKIILTSHKVCNFKKRELIYSDWNNNTRIFFILAGSAFSFRYDRDGNKIIYYKYNRYDFINIVNLFKKTVSNLSVQSAADSIIISWPKETIIKLIDEDTTFCREIFHIYSNRIGQLANQIEILKSNRSAYRFSNYILGEIERLGRSNELNPSIEIDLYIKSIASYLSVSREILSRLISKMKKEKIIQLKNHMLYVVNLHKLKNLAEKR